MSQLFHHLLQLAKLRHEEKAEITIKLWSAEGEVWLSVADAGSNSYEMDLMPSMEGGQGLGKESFNHGQMELAIVKSIAEQMRYQVWIHQTEKGGPSIAVCLSEWKEENGKGSM